MKANKPVYFVSPHLDDAAFSAGSIMTLLYKHVPTTLINVFTKAGEPPFTLSGKKYLKLCNYPDLRRLYADRIQEDEQACESIVDRIINLGFIDALWRKIENQPSSIINQLIPEVNHIYPTYRFHILKGIISDYDTPTIKKLIFKLSKFPTDSIVFCPLGIGGHVDHLLVRKACETVFQKVIYWLDYPYSTHNPIQYHSLISLNSFLIPTSHFNKLNLLKKYRTQYSSTFSTTPTIPPEIYYFPKSFSLHD